MSAVSTGPRVRTASVNDYPAELITLSSDSCTAVLTDLGARLLEMHVPDANGHHADVVLGRPDLTRTLADPNYFGATAGRYANRIRAGRFHLDGVDYQLATNEGANHLHGGYRGFDRYSWSTELDTHSCAVTFSRISPHGEESFPGELLTRTRYELSGSTLDITMTAETDRPTIVNLVNHAYWNLAGHQSGNVLDHTLQIFASKYTPVDEHDLLPTGEVSSVRDTPFDFLAPTPIKVGNRMVKNFGAGRSSTESAGYDHNWAIDGIGMRKAAILTDPGCGRRLELSTNQPGVHVYVGGYLGGVEGKLPVDRYPAYAGLTLETQTYPDAINHPHFPSPILRPGDAYRNEVSITFSTS